MKPENEKLPTQLSIELTSDGASMRIDTSLEHVSKRLARAILSALEMVADLHDDDFTAWTEKAREWLHDYKKSKSDEGEVAS